MNAVCYLLAKYLKFSSKSNKIKSLGVRPREKNCLFPVTVRKEIG